MVSTCPIILSISSTRDLGLYLTQLEKMPGLYINQACIKGRSLLAIPSFDRKSFVMALFLTILTVTMSTPSQDLYGRNHYLIGLR